MAGPIASSSFTTRMWMAGFTSDVSNKTAEQHNTTQQHSHRQQKKNNCRLSFNSNEKTQIHVHTYMVRTRICVKPNTRRSARVSRYCRASLSHRSRHRPMQYSQRQTTQNKKKQSVRRRAAITISTIGPRLQFRQKLLVGALLSRCSPADI